MYVEISTEGENMEKYIRVLEHCPLFQGMEEEQIFQMMKYFDARVVHFRKNETVLREGDKTRCMGIVLAGQAKVVRVDFWGNRSIVTHIEQGELFGESFVWAGVERMPVDVVASEETEVLLIDCLKMKQNFTDSEGTYGQIICNLLKIVASKNLFFNQKIEITSKRTTREKLMTYLQLQAKRAGSNQFTIPYNRQELADFLQVERSGLSVEISKLRKEGVIDNQKEHFTLL